jgi:hypothetical protein
MASNDLVFVFPTMTIRARNMHVSQENLCDLPVLHV